MQKSLPATASNSNSTDTMVKVDTDSDRDSTCQDRQIHNTSVPESSVTSVSTGLAVYNVTDEAGRLSPQGHLSQDASSSKDVLRQPQPWHSPPGKRKRHVNTRTRARTGADQGSNAEGGSEEEEPRAPDPLDKFHLLCAVCGDRAQSYNFGGISCESCKSFFRRNGNHVESLSCVGSGSCSITKATRRFCGFCRMRRCLQVGMQLEWLYETKRRPNIVGGLSGERGSSSSASNNKPARRPGRPRKSPTCAFANESSGRQDSPADRSSRTPYSSLSINISDSLSQAIDRASGLGSGMGQGRAAHSGNNIKPLQGAGYGSGSGSRLGFLNGVSQSINPHGENNVSLLPSCSSVRGDLSFLSPHSTSELRPSGPAPYPGLAHPGLGNHSSSNDYSAQASSSVAQVRASTQSGPNEFAHRFSTLEHMLDTQSRAHMLGESPNAHSSSVQTVELDAIATLVQALSETRGGNEMTGELGSLLASSSDFGGPSSQVLWPNGYGQTQEALRKSHFSPPGAPHRLMPQFSLPNYAFGTEFGSLAGSTGSLQTIENHEAASTIFQPITNSLMISQNREATYSASPVHSTVGVNTGAFPRYPFQDVEVTSNNQSQVMTANYISNSSHTNFTAKLLQTNVPSASLSDYPLAPHSNSIYDSELAFIHQCVMNPNGNGSTYSVPYLIDLPKSPLDQKPVGSLSVPHLLNQQAESPSPKLHSSNRATLHSHISVHGSSPNYYASGSQGHSISRGGIFELHRAKHKLPRLRVYNAERRLGYETIVEISAIGGRRLSHASPTESLSPNRIRTSIGRFTPREYTDMMRNCASAFRTLMSPLSEEEDARLPLDMKSFQDMERIVDIGVRRLLNAFKVIDEFKKLPLQMQIRMINVNFAILVRWLCFLHLYPGEPTRGTTFIFLSHPRKRPLQLTVAKFREIMDSLTPGVDPCMQESTEEAVRLLLTYRGHRFILLLVILVCLFSPHSLIGSTAAIDAELLPHAVSAHGRYVQLIRQYSEIFDNQPGPPLLAPEVSSHSSIQGTFGCGIAIICHLLEMDHGNADYSSEEMSRLYGPLLQELYSLSVSRS